MKKLLAIACLLTVSYVSVNAQSSKQQNSVSPKSEAYRILGDIKEGQVRTFNYNETPKFALRGQNASFWQKLTPQQMAALETYGCPKYTSSGTNSLELDVSNYKKALKAWDEKNMYRQTEILNALGIKK